MTNRTSIKIGFISLFRLFLFIPVVSISAQSYGRIEQTQSNMASYYYLVQPGSPTIRVSVMGPVRYPGVYEIGKGSDLMHVLSLSGGVDQSRVDFINKQRTTIRLFRPAALKDKPFFESLLEETLTGKTKPVELLEGDILVLDVAAWKRFDWRDVLTIASVVNTVVLIILAVKSFDE